MANITNRERTDLRRLLKVAQKWIRDDTDCLEECHMHPVTERIEPAEVRRLVRARRRWLSQAEAALR